MPIYEFECTKCGQKYTKLKNIKDESVPTCCEEETIKVPSLTAARRDMTVVENS